MYKIKMSKTITIVLSCAIVFLFINSSIAIAKFELETNTAVTQIQTAPTTTLTETPAHRFAYVLAAGNTVENIATSTTTDCNELPFSSPPTICDLRVFGLSINSTTALVLEKVNLTNIYLHIIHEQEFQQRVAGFAWDSTGWGPYTEIGDTSVTFPYDNQITPRGVVFWFTVHVKSDTIAQFFGAYDLVEGNYTISHLSPSRPEIVAPGPAPQEAMITSTPTATSTPIPTTPTPKTPAFEAISAIAALLAVLLIRRK